MDDEAYELYKRYAPSDAREWDDLEESEKAFWRREVEFDKRQALLKQSSEDCSK
jgi:hypothetical protein